jgi:predicted oxidoreductase (fatty acid repression mutant protein)
MSAPLTAQSFIDLMKNRRSHYALTKDMPISTARVEEIAKAALEEVPSSFNSQSNRMLVLFGAEHDKLWDLTRDVLKAIVPEGQFASTAKRMAGFKGAAGTVLFFKDTSAVSAIQAKVPLYTDRFPTWATQSDGMLQYAVWVALEAEGLGANLQHYNPLIDAQVAELWNIPASWTLEAQVVFGAKAGEAGPKTYLPIEERYKSYGA